MRFFLILSMAVKDKPQPTLSVNTNVTVNRGPTTTEFFFN